MSNLASYLLATGLSRRAFARRIGRDPSIVSRLCSGAIRPSLVLAFEIEAATGGAVPAAGWVDLAQRKAC